MIVLDASAAVHLVLDTPTGLSIEERIRPPAASLHAPYLLDLECTSALRKLVSLGEITVEMAVAGLQRLLRLPAHRYPYDDLLHRIWALRDNITPYDAAYIALAEALGATLITCDVGLANAPGHRARVEVFR